MLKVPGWIGSIAALAALAPLPLQAYESLHDTLLDGERGEAEWARRFEGTRDALTTTERSIEEAGSDGDIPDKAAIAATRERRDLGWRLVFRQAFTAAPPRPEELEAWTGGVPLPLAYERAVSAADAVADQHVVDAERVQRAAGLEQTRQRQEAELAAAQQALDHARKISGWTRTDWAAKVEPFGLPGTVGIAAVREFLARREIALDAERKACDAAHDAEVLAAQHANWATRLALVLGEEAVTGLPELLHVAGFVEQARSERAVEVEKLRVAREQAAKLRSDEAEYNASLDLWRLEWTSAMAALWQAPGLQPDTASEVLELFDELEKALGLADQHADRVRVLRGCLEGFSKQVEHVARVAAPDLSEVEPFSVARSLATKLSQARKAADQHEERERTLREAEHEKGAAEEAEHNAAAELRTIVTLAGAEDEADAERRIELAEVRALHEAERADAKASLLDAGDGLPFGALRAEVALASPEERTTQTQLARGRQEKASALAQDAAARASQLEMTLIRDAAAEAATHAAHDEAAAAASLARVLEEAVLLQAALSLLDHGLQVVERSGDSPLVTRIGSAFNALTLGTYNGLALRPDEKGKPRLMAVEHAFPDDLRAVDELSEGTRDQLFLALRLIAIEDHLASSPPLPFVADDILQTFDDARATATLRALLALSERTQVIVLTHHDHVPELAQALPHGTVHLQRFG